MELNSTAGITHSYAWGMTMVLYNTYTAKFIQTPKNSPIFYFMPSLNRYNKIQNVSSATRDNLIYLCIAAYYYCTYPVQKIPTDQQNCTWKLQGGSYKGWEWGGTLSYRLYPVYDISVSLETFPKPYNNIGFIAKLPKSWLSGQSLMPWTMWHRPSVITEN